VRVEKTGFAIVLPFARPGLKTEQRLFEVADAAYGTAWRRLRA